MAKFEVKVKVTGINKVRMKLGNRAASDLADSMDILMGVLVRNTAGDAAENAPVDTGALQASIRHSTKRTREAEYIFGSYMPYAQRQEYEHKTKYAYFRKAMWKNTPIIEYELTQLVKKRLG